MTDENIWSRSLDSNNIKCLHAKKVKKLKYSQKRWGRFWLNLRGYFFFNLVSSSKKLVNSLFDLLKMEGLRMVISHTFLKMGPSEIKPHLQEN